MSPIQTVNYYYFFSEVKQRNLSNMEVAYNRQIVPVRSALMLTLAPDMLLSGQQHVVNGRIVSYCPLVMITMWPDKTTPPSPLKHNEAPPGTALLDTLVSLTHFCVAAPQGMGLIKKQLVDFRWSLALHPHHCKACSCVVMFMSCKFVNHKLIMPVEAVGPQRQSVFIRCSVITVLINMDA